MVILLLNSFVAGFLFACCFILGLVSVALVKEFIKNREKE
jgi:hypothetical protein